MRRYPEGRNSVKSSKVPGGLGLAKTLRLSEKAGAMNMKAELSRVHWGQVMLTGLLVAIQVYILTTVVVWLLFAFHVLGQPNQSLPVIQVADWSLYLLVAIPLTVRGGLRVAHKLEREPPLHSSASLHGLLVGLVAALILVGPYFLGGLHLAMFVVLGTFVLTVAAGWLGGVWGSRGRER